MGCFRRLWVDLKCKRCRSPFATAVQFKTGNDGRMEEYEPGDIVPDLSGCVFEAYADNYCEPCRDRWNADQATVNLEQLALSIEAGEVAARRVLQSVGLGDPLTPAEVRQIHPIRSSPESRLGVSLRSLLEETSVVLLSRRGVLLADPSACSPDPDLYWALHSERVDQRLAHMGWLPAWSRRMVTLRVAPDGTIGLDTD
jgi:hypothetical protein